MGMAHYETSVTTDLSPAEAFARMADMTRFKEWDPGVLDAKQVAGNGPGLDAAYLLTVKGVPKPLPLKYVVTEFENGVRFRALAKAKMFRSDDVISVEPNGSGSTVTYTADLLLEGPLRIFDFALGPVFNRIGDAADGGLRKFLK